MSGHYRRFHCIEDARLYLAQARHARHLCMFSSIHFQSSQLTSNQVSTSIMTLAPYLIQYGHEAYKHYNAKPNVMNEYVVVAPNYVQMYDHSLYLAQLLEKIGENSDSQVETNQAENKDWLDYLVDGLAHVGVDWFLETLAS